MTPDPLHSVDPLDEHLDALGGELDRGVVRAERRRRRRIGVAGTGALLAAIGLGALVALPGGRDLDPVAQARAAVSEEGGGILHYVARMQFIPPAGSRTHPARDPGAMEVWTTTDGDGHYRVREPADGRPRFCGTMTFTPPGTGRRGSNVGAMLTAPGEIAQNGTTRTFYSTFSRAALVQELTPEQARLSVSPRGYGLTPRFGAADTRDPVRTVRSALRTGELQDGGTVTVDGRTLRKLFGTSGPTPQEAHRLAEGDADERRRWRGEQLAADRPIVPTRYTYLVDAASSAPVLLRTERHTIWSRAGGRRHWVWTTEETRFERYERLPATAETLAQLEIAFPAGTTIYRTSADGRLTPAVGLRQAMRREHAAVGRCTAAMR